MKIKQQLITQLPPTLIDELLGTYEESKKEFFLGGLRLSAVEGGRFCEAAFRLLEYITTGSFTPLGKQINTDSLISQLSNLPSAHYKDAVRIHIPRSLRLVYDIRNKRDAAHLGDGIDPNVQDATLICSVLDWVLAEFIRLYHVGSAHDAEIIIDDLIEKSAPIIQDFDGFLKVLNPSLKASDHCLVLLYQCGKKGAVFENLREWAKPSMRRNLRATLSKLVSDKAYLHSNGNKYYITKSGMLYVEKNRLFEQI